MFIEEDYSMFQEQPGLVHAKYRFTNQWGLYASVPMDVLHTLPNGCMKMLKQIIIVMASK